MRDEYQPEPADDYYVDIAGAVPVFHKLGFADVTERCVRRYADEGKLPFFRGIGRRRMIEVKELRLRIKKLQIEASRGSSRRM